MASTKEQMEAASAYYRRGDYRSLKQAHRILRKVDHPKAKAALPKVEAKIREVQPPFYIRRFRLLAVASVLALVVVFGVWFADSYRTGSIRSSIFITCNHLESDLYNTPCDPDDIEANHYEDAVRCYDRVWASGEYDSFMARLDQMVGCYIYRMDL